MYFLKNKLCIHNTINSIHKTNQHIPKNRLVNVGVKLLHLLNPFKIIAFLK